MAAEAPHWTCAPSTGLRTWCVAGERLDVQLANARTLLEPPKACAEAFGKGGDSVAAGSPGLTDTAERSISMCVRRRVRYLRRRPYP